MKTRDIFIGIDGGGSKSKVRIEDAEGHLLGQAMSGPANIRLSVEGAWRSIYAAIEEVLHPQGIFLADKNNRYHMGLGLAGCEVPEAVQTFLTNTSFFYDSSVRYRCAYCLFRCSSRRNRRHYYCGNGCSRLSN